MLELTLSLEDTRICLLIALMPGFPDVSCRSLSLSPLQQMKNYLRTRH
jgi:hypothetical protein